MNKANRFTNDRMYTLGNIKIIWIWWSWINAVNRMIELDLDWSEFIVMDKEDVSLAKSLANIKINISNKESKKQIVDLLEWTDMLFLVSWFWWNTWSTYLPKIAEISKKLWILTIWVITKPFSYEWDKRLTIYNNYIKWLKSKLDTLVTIKNDNLLKILPKWSSIKTHRSTSDELIHKAISWITDTFIQPNLIGVDIQDVKTLWFRDQAWLLIRPSIDRIDTRKDYTLKNCI